MRVIATLLSCVALLSCSTEPDAPKSPVLGDAVRAPGVVWSTETLGCSQISSEDARLDTLSKANEIERRSLVRQRNILLVEWLIPYYGWVATARAGLVEDEIKGVDLVIEDAGDRRQELKQFALVEGCAGTVAETADAVTLMPVMAPSQPDAPPVVEGSGSAPGLTRPGATRPAVTAARPKASAARATAIRPVAVAASAGSARPASQSAIGTPIAGNSVTLPLAPAADVTAALQQR